jgi:hypothetical protein
MKRPLLFIIILLFLNSAFAQEGPTPAQTLRLARATYEQGRLHEIPTQLNDEVIAKMSKQEKVDAHKILCLTYIYLEEPAKADQSMLNILLTDPYFEINEVVDPAEFVALYRTFRTRPIYRVGAKLGINASQPNVIESVTAVELSDDSEYKYGLGLLFGGVVDVPINDKMTLHGELLYIQKKFEIDLKVNRGQDALGETLINQFEGIETQSWLSIPLSFEYKIMEKKFNPYIAGGVSIDYLLNDELVGERTREDASAIPESTFELKPQREKINISALVAAGAKFKIAGGFFVAEVRYLYGLTKVNSEETAYANQEATWEQGYADPVFKVSSLALTGSYIHNIFNPKKLKRKK